MKSSWTKSALGAAAALLFSFVGSAHAYVIDFETINTAGLSSQATAIGDGEVMTQGAFSVQVQDPYNPTLTDGPYIGDPGIMVAQLSNASNVESCPYGTTCPRGSSGTFLSTYNDAIVHIGATDGSALNFSGLSAAYIAMSGNASGSTVYLAVEGDRTDGSYAAAYYVLPSNQAFTTITSATTGYALDVSPDVSSTGSLFSGSFRDLFVYGYYCDAAKQACSAFGTDQASFALDNVNVAVAAAVPEPSEWMLMAAGLGAIGAIVRRRKSVAAA